MDFYIWALTPLKWYSVLTPLKFHFYFSWLWNCKLVKITIVIQVNIFTILSGFLGHNFSYSNFDMAYNSKTHWLSYNSLFYRRLIYIKPKFISTIIHFLIRNLKEQNTDCFQPYVDMLFSHSILIQNWLWINQRVWKFLVWDQSYNPDINCFKIR